MAGVRKAGRCPAGTAPEVCGVRQPGPAVPRTPGEPQCPSFCGCDDLAGAVLEPGRGGDRGSPSQACLPAVGLRAPAGMCAHTQPHVCTHARPCPHAPLRSATPGNASLRVPEYTPPTVPRVKARRSVVTPSRPRASPLVLTLPAPGRAPPAAPQPAGAASVMGWLGVQSPSLPGHSGPAGSRGDPVTQVPRAQDMGRWEAWKVVCHPSQQPPGHRRESAHTWPAAWPLSVLWAQAHGPGGSESVSPARDLLRRQAAPPGQEVTAASHGPRAPPAAEHAALGRARARVGAWAMAS